VGYTGDRTRQGGYGRAKVKSVERVTFGWWWKVLEAMLMYYVNGFGTESRKTKGEGEIKKRLHLKSTMMITINLEVMTRNRA
jgi:hypothetical protein